MCPCASNEHSVFAIFQERNINDHIYVQDVSKIEVLPCCQVFKTPVRCSCDDLEPEEEDHWEDTESGKSPFVFQTVTGHTLRTHTLFTNFDVSVKFGGELEWASQTGVDTPK
jgi:hypothetical protein